MKKIIFFIIFSLSLTAYGQNKFVIKGGGSGSVGLDSTAYTLAVFYTTGSSYTIPSSTAGRIAVYVTSASGTQAITFPSTPRDRQEIEIHFDSDVPTFSKVASSGYTFKEAFTTTTFSAGEVMKFRTNISNTTYYAN